MVFAQSYSENLSFQACGVWDVMPRAASPACCPFFLCYNCSSIAMSPYYPVFEMWFWVLLNCTGYLWHLPCAVLAPTPALNSVWCFGSIGLYSLTDLDLHVGNSAEGKQLPRSGWCLVWTQDRWCGHSGTGSVHDGALIALLAISSVAEWAQVGSGCCCGDKGLWAGGFVRLMRKSPQTKDICWDFFRKQRWA